ncbi:MAG: hypothetical protein HY000_21000 [Planctomycetes bacterium]|nr:hypothetical protein [Planctomycetota bacterium]
MSATLYGLDVPHDFPIAPFDAVDGKVKSKAQQTSAQQKSHFAGGWKGIGYRFLSCVKADEQFTRSIGASARNHQNRFDEEEALFAFFVNGLASIESFLFGLYWVGTIAEPSRFPSVADKDLRDINSEHTLGLVVNGPYRPHFQKGIDRLSTYDAATGKKVANTAQYTELKAVRNILAHRAHYGRNLFGVLKGNPPIDDEWQTGAVTLNSHTTRTRRAWLAETLRLLLESAEAYTAQTL